MSQASRVSLSVIVFFASVIAAVAQASHSHPSDGQLRACRDKLAYHSKFTNLPMAAFSVHSGSHKHRNVDWSVSWDGRKANGTCRVNEHGKVEEFDIRHDSVSGHKTSHHEGAEKPKHGFYYDRHVNQWRDPDGHVCHTCTPENGFPNHGQKDQHWKPENHYEREMARQLNRTLTDEDLRNLRELYNK